METPRFALLARLAEARRTELHRLQVRDACKRVFYSVHQIMLSESVSVTKIDKWEKRKRFGCRVEVAAERLLATKVMGVWAMTGDIAHWVR